MQHRVGLGAHCQFVVATKANVFSVVAPLVALNAFTAFKEVIIQGDLWSFMNVDYG